MNTIIEWLFGINDLSGGDDWRFSFIGDASPYVILTLVTVLAGMAVLTIMSYLREGDAKLSVKLILAGLRMGAILLALAIILRPAIVWKITRTAYSTVLILIDDSKSMAFKDRYPGKEAGADSVPNADVKEVAASLGVSEDEVRQMTRTQIMVRKLQPVIDELAKRHHVEIASFSPDAASSGAYTRRLGSFSFIPPAKGEPAPTPAPAASQPATVSEALAGLQGRGDFTLISTGIRDGVRDILQGKRGHIVIWSDMQQTGTDVDSRLASVREYAGRLGYGIMGVIVGDVIPPKNLALVGLRADREVRQNSTVEFVTKAMHRGLANQTINVKLERRRDKETNWSAVKNQSVKLVNNSKDPDLTRSFGEQSVEFAVEMEDIGDYVYRVIADARSDEQTANDNLAEAPVKITDKQIKILLVSGDAGFEFQFLKNYLITQPELFKVSIWQQDADTEVNQSASTGMKLETFPSSLEAIMGSADGKWPGYDAVILYDPMPTASVTEASDIKGGFDKEFLKNLKTAVETHGIGLCYIAGNKYTGSNLNPTKKEFDDLRYLVPVRVSTVDIPVDMGEKSPEAQMVRLAVHGMDHPVTKLGVTSEDRFKLWDRLPGVFWSHKVEYIKPIARVLAVNENPSRKVNGRQFEPIIVTQPIGRGRVLYMNTDETWRWRIVDEMQLYRNFWRNAIKYLTPSISRQVIISTGGERFYAGQKVKVEVEAYDKDYKPLVQTELRLLKIRKDVPASDVNKEENREIVIVKPLDADDTGTDPKERSDKAGRYEVEIMAKVGVYELTTEEAWRNRDDPKEAGKVEPKEFFVDEPQAEIEHPEANPSTLDSLVTKPEFGLKVQNAGDLLEQIHDDRLPTVTEKARELWDTRISIVLIVLLLTAEWIIRKRHNMA